jgi:hypothetical protein
MTSLLDYHQVNWTKVYRYIYVLPSAMDNCQKTIIQEFSTFQTNLLPPNIKMASAQSPLARYRQLAPLASVRVSHLCLGTMTFRGTHPEKHGECSKEDAFAIMDHFYDNGENFLDTANVYQDGNSEVWVGEWMAARKNRDDLVLATKYSSPYRLHEKDRIQTNYIGNEAKSMKISLESSLRKLQTTHIDLFYVHWWDYTTSIPENDAESERLGGGWKSSLSRHLRHTSLGGGQGESVRPRPWSTTIYRVPRHVECCHARF